MTVTSRWTGRTLNLVLGDELWGPVDDHPAFAEIVGREMAIGPNLGAAKVRAKYLLTVNLCLDVAQAASAIDYSVAKLDALVDEVDRSAAEFLKSAGSMATGYGHPSLEGARVEFVNTLTWTQALLDRLDRKDPAQPRFDSSPKLVRSILERLFRSGTRRHHLGFVPAMNPLHPATPKVKVLVSTLKSRLVDASRLRNFGVHVAIWPYPLASAPLSEDGRITLQLPDALLTNLYSYLQLSYDDGRDARTYAHEVEDAVAEFMEAFLTVLEDAARNRWQP